MNDAPEADRLDEVLHTLAARVRRMREERDLSITALSFEAGLSESRVRALEAGRTTASLATLVALAETFEVDVAELFADPVRAAAPVEPASAYVVPSEVIWGGELPPAPWMPEAAAAPAPSPYVVPSEVVWGGDLPPAAWTTAVAAPTMPEATSGARPAPPAVTPTETTWGGSLPDAPWVAPVPAPPVASVSVPVSSRVPAGVSRDIASNATSAAESVHRRAAAHGVEHMSPYVLVVQGQTPPRQPRTFADLREGVLAGREFRSLREFAIAAVAEANHSPVAVARVFRLPVWRLEEWVREAGYVATR
ncbi:MULTISPECIES: helix-turn-helix domain-containing protein [Microbacterium]|uniref:Helix-turn-helix transcriptional regulator n=1 Tax=Microbacterium algihabitans TaxID=3075992 RepID=A0ABU3RSH8_9MICO|nr:MULTISPECIES: helix-turn-helix transcriptional regulator [Microbacterium]MCD2168890.1 helix-turn-helix transcriptional regulator [Microbacterium sp. JC 701]MDU0325707.1 helix-turn-helix transcriptional regulator [Microbacterium sp. KSW2-21]